MTTNALIQQLKNEATANPKKMAILGLMLLVGVYFWAPLLLEWVGPGEQLTAKETAPTATQPISSAGQAKPIGKVKEGQGANVPWRDLADWMKADPNKSPMLMPLTDRNPFALVVPEVVAVNPLENGEGEPGAEIEVDARPLVEVTPEELGLKLTSTFVGRNTRRAVIGGEIHGIGDLIERTTGDRTVEFEVTAIESQGVTLTAGEKRYTLALPRKVIKGVERP